MDQVTTSDGGVLSLDGVQLRWLIFAGNDPALVVDSLSASWLSAAEIAYESGLKSAKRRHDWRLGRHAAKLLVAEVLREQTGRQFPLNQIIVLPHADGWPVVTLSPEGPPITLSISHARDYAFCAAMVGENRPLGADIEYAEPRSAAFVEDYFTPVEQALLAAAPPEQHTWLTNAIWSGKEAALKAIRRGLTEDTRLVSCLPDPLLGLSPEWLPMRIVWNDPARGLPLLVGRWRPAGPFVLTLAASAAQVSS
jgi:4'-phosphopantetheinyl transferase